MTYKKPTALLVCVAAAAVLLLANTHVSQSQNSQMKLGGSFVGTGAAGLWSSTAAPLDPAAKTANLRVFGIAMPGFVPLLAALGADTFGEMVGQQEMLNRDTAKYNVIGYATQGATVKAILQMYGTTKFETADRLFVVYTIKVFAPSADANHDGFPDAGATPIMPPIEGGDYANRVLP